MRSIIFSFLLLSGCAAIQRPPVDFLIVNAPKKYARGYNFKTDYNDNGDRLPNAVPKIYPAEKIEDLNKWFCVNMRDDKGVQQPADALKLMTAYIKKLREEYERGCKPPAAASQ